MAIRYSSLNPPGSGGGGGGAGPDPVTNFVATPVTATKIDLTWDDLSDEDHYLIEISDDAGSNWTHLRTLPPGTVAFTVTALSGNTTYHFRIRGINDSGISIPATEANATTEDSPIVDADTHFHYVAEDYNDLTGEWPDRSGKDGAAGPGSNRNLILAAGAAPTLNAAWSNGQAAVSFDGTNALKTALPSSGFLWEQVADASAIFMVGDRLNNTSPNVWKWMFHGNNTNADGVGIFTRDGPPRDIVFVRDEAFQRTISVGKVYVLGEKFIVGYRLVGLDYDARHNEISDSGTMSTTGDALENFVNFGLGGLITADGATVTPSHEGHFARLLAYHSNIGATLFNEIFESLASEYGIPIV